MTEESYEKWRMVEIERGVAQRTWGQLSPEEQAALEGPEEKPDYWDKTFGEVNFGPRPKLTAEEELAAQQHMSEAYEELRSEHAEERKKFEEAMAGWDKPKTLVDAPPDSDEGEVRG